MAKKKHGRTTPKLLNRVALAKAMNVVPSTITRWERDGMPVAKRTTRGRETLFDLDAVAAWDAARQRQPILDGAQARARKDLAIARLTEIRIEIEEGRLVSRESVLAAGQAYTIAWAAKVRTLPRRLVKEGLVAREHEADVAARCREILEDISSWNVPTERASS